MPWGCRCWAKEIRFTGNLGKKVEKRNNDADMQHGT